MTRRFPACSKKNLIWWLFATYAAGSLSVCYKALGKHNDTLLKETIFLECGNIVRSIGHFQFEMLAKHASYDFVEVSQHFAKKYG
jgi:hypothetical protein